MAQNEAGRRLYAAMMSHRLGVSVEYFLKKYAPDTVDEDWELLARMIDDCIADSNEDKLSGRGEASPTLIDRLKAKLLVDR